MVSTIQRKPWLLVLAVGLGTLLNPLNSSMIAVALTRLQHEFQLSFADASWLISAFYLASAAAQPVMGKLGDMFGPKRLFITGLVIVAISSSLAPLSPSYWWLVAFRALQAVGSSTLFPSGMSIVRSSITKGQAQALSTLAVFSSVSAAFGPSIGGFLIESWDWQAVFLINIPFLVIGFLLAIFVLPNREKGYVDIKRIDFAGIVLFTVAIITLILFLLSLNGHIRWWAVPVFIISSIGFYGFEMRWSEPFIDLKAIKGNKNVSFIYLQFMTINIVFYSIFFGMPTFLQQVRHYSERETGMIMLSIAGFGVVIAPLAGRWIDRAGSKPPLFVGAISVLIGTALLLTIHAGTTVWWIFIVMSVLGISNGFNNISMQTALYDFVTPEETGSASGLFQTSRYLGSILSSSLLGLLFNRHMDVAHLHMVAIVCFICSFIILGLTFRMPGKSRRKRIHEG
jgi:EmrB/QacA subfamily drug resistance transporter